MCGGTASPSGRARTARGLSPRVRGNHLRIAGAVDTTGSIPACAGEPENDNVYTTLRQVYPRVCGGTGLPAASRAMLEGLSPRVRGNRERALAMASSRRSIPACAGEPSTSPDSTPSVRGLSPRVRGNPARVHRQHHAGGSIPACAGEPDHAGRRPERRRVYPRVCGGTHTSARPVLWHTGLSPRVRGNPGSLGLPRR